MNRANAPKTQVRRLAHIPKTSRPIAPSAHPNTSATSRDRRPDGSGRAFVRSINASTSCSRYMFSALAEATIRHVPTIVQASEGKTKSPGAKAAPSQVVTKTRRETPGFVNCHSARAVSRKS